MNKMPLIFDEFKIDKISGPITIKLAQPQNNYNLPLIFLFGDVHDSYQFFCKERSSDDLNHLCHHIFDHDFFQKIDQMSKQYDFIVYVYGEFMQLDTRQQYISRLTNQDEIQDAINQENLSLLEDGTPIRKFYYNFYSCFNSFLKEQKPHIFQDLCKAPNINWKIIDPRVLPLKSNQEFSNFNDKYETCMKHFWQLFDFVFNKDLTFDHFFKKTQELQKTKFHDKVLLVSLCKNIQLMYYTSDTTIFANFLFDENNIFFKNHSMSMIQLQSIDQNKILDVDIKEAIKRYYYVQIVQNHLINHIHRFLPEEYRSRSRDQIVMQTIQSLQPISELVLYIKMFIEANSKQDKKQIFNEHIKVILEGIHERSNKNKPLYEDEYQLQKPIYVLPNIDLTWINSELTTFLLDIYFIGKVLNSNSHLTVAYLGEAHCDNIAKFLRQVFGYINFPIQVKSSHDEIRCIHMIPYFDYKVQNLLQDIKDKRTYQ